MKGIRSEEAIHYRYLIANEQDLLWGLTINTIGRQTIRQHESYPPNQHPTRYLFSVEKGRILSEYQLLYITQGSGTFQSSSCRQMQVKAGSMFLLFPDEWHSYKPDASTGWEEFWIGFKGENIDYQVKNGFFNRQKPVFFVGILEEIVQLYEQGISVAKEQKTGFQQMLAGIVTHLLGLAYSLNKYQSFENLNVTDQINKAKILFADNFQQDINLEEVAKEINMSYSWFRRLFKKYTGFSPAQYIHELRLQHSKVLLTNTNLTIKEIAFKSGFEYLEYFCTAFKNKTKMTPVQYREFTQGKNI
ncbi:MAG: AraC family transcriptional regulator [Candidatus Azobacteroides sp.]|nr:AraC family transcriptional regulator [Candidatus Azobacteroides sp.]